MFSVLDVTTVLWVQEACALGSQKSKGGNGGDANAGNNTKTTHSEAELPHDQIKDEYQDSEAYGVNADDEKESDDDEVSIPDDDEIFEGKIVSCFSCIYLLVRYCVMHFIVS